MAKPRPELPSDSVFHMRGQSTRWPTLRKAYLNDISVERIRALSHGVVFVQEYYHTRLNKFAKPPRDSKERMLFFEHKVHPPKHKAYYLLCWIGNYYNGSVFHVAPQYPQCMASTPKEIEKACFQLYCKVARYLYWNSEEGMDDEVKEFIHQPTKGIIT